MFSSKRTVQPAQVASPKQDNTKDMGIQTSEFTNWQQCLSATYAFILLDLRFYASCVNILFESCLSCSRFKGGAYWGLTV